MRKAQKSGKADTRKAHNLRMKKCVARTRRRAKFVGILYLLATIIVAGVVALFPLLTHELAPIGAMEFWKVFTKMDVKTANGVITLVNCVLYGLLLLSLVINVLKALGKLGGLFSRKATKEDGFNRNVYALEDLGKLFGRSFANILITYFLIAILCGQVALVRNIRKYLLVLLGVAVLTRLILGFWGAKIGYYTVKKRMIVEQQTREIGRIAPCIRNLFQFAAIFAILFYFLKVNALNATLVTLVEGGDVSALTGDLNALINAGAQVLILLCSSVLIKHATGIAEYDIDGTEARGMKNFRVFSFFIFLFAAAVVAYDYLVVKSGKLDMNMLIIAGVAFVAFVIELIMSKMPRERDELDENGESEYFTFEEYLQEQAEAAAAAKAAVRNAVEEDSEEFDW